MTRTYDWHGHTHEIGLPNLTDKAMASAIRMLSRSDRDHEHIVRSARDRIMCLVKEKAQLTAERDELLRALKEVLDHHNAMCRSVVH